MPDNKKCHSKDLSVYDSMKSEDLEALLLADIELNNQETDMEVVCYVMNILAEREGNSGTSQKAPREAYAEFRKNYTYSDNDLTDTEDAGNLSEGRKASVLKAPSRIIPIGKRISRVAIIAVAMLSITIALAMSVEAIRKPVIDFLLKHFSNHSMVLFSDECTEIPMEYDIWEAIENAPIPDGYESILQDVDQNRIILLRYQNQSGARIHLLITPANGVFDFDTEDFTKQEITINGHEGMLFAKDGDMIIIWLDEDHSALYFLRTYDTDESIFWENANYWASRHINMGGEIE